MTLASLTLLLALGAERPITFGIAQPYGPEHAKQAAAKLEPWLTSALKGPVKVSVYATSEELADAMATNAIDLAWITPGAFVQASQKNGDAQAIAKAMRVGGGGLYYRSVLVVKKDAPFKALADLKGKKVAWAGKLSASGYLFPRELIRTSGFDPDKFFGGELMADNHQAVCQAVRDGKADVGATFASEPAEGKDAQADGCSDAGPIGDYRVIASTGNIPTEVIAASGKFEPRRINDVLGAFAKLSTTKDGKALLKDVFRLEGFGVAVDGDFDQVVKLLGAKGAKVAHAADIVLPKGPPVKKPTPIVPDAPAADAGAK
ncbi:MAG: phosphate/phosphite/phosphonate ABC transporter substrate-binding protein [Myxococcaceae bacterium]|nr:phosphate/phosphite/phosphonate ABC transporter substrate-binding protein [Myxococcaceae bacterium]